MFITEGLILYEVIIVSDRKVTGTALGEILNATKNYIDSKDLGFEEVDLDITGTPQVPVIGENLTYEQVQNVIGKYFIK